MVIHITKTAHIAFFVHLITIWLVPASGGRVLPLSTLLFLLSVFIIFVADGAAVTVAIASCNCGV